MDFHFPQKVRLGQGVSQHVGLAAKDSGSRALLITESVFDASKELGILTQSLDRAVVAYIILSKNASQSPSSFLDEVTAVARASRTEVLIVLGGNALLSLGRAAALAIPRGKKDEKGNKISAGVPCIEVPSSVCFPLLLREEAFLGSGHPSDLKFFNTPLFHKHRIFLDPHMATGLTPTTSVTGLLETLFFAVEALFHEACGLTEESLLLGAIGSIWESLRKIYENPSNVEYRLASYQAGFNVALALALLPRGVGLTLTFVLGGLLSTPPTAFGSLFLAPFLEVYGPKVPERMLRLSRAMQMEEAVSESLGPRLAQDVRKFLNAYKLPLRLSEHRIVDSQIVSAVDVVKAMGLRHGGQLEAETLPEFLTSLF